MRKQRALLLRIGAVTLSVVLGGSYVAYRVFAGRPAGAPPSAGVDDRAEPGRELPPARFPSRMSGSKSMTIFEPESVPEHPPSDPLLNSTKRGVIVTPEDLTPTTFPEPGPLGPR